MVLFHYRRNIASLNSSKNVIDVDNLMTNAKECDINESVAVLPLMLALRPASLTDFVYCSVTKKTSFNYRKAFNYVNLFINKEKRSNLFFGLSIMHSALQYICGFKTLFTLYLEKLLGNR